MGKREWCVSLAGNVEWPTLHSFADNMASGKSLCGRSFVWGGTVPESEAGGERCRTCVRITKAAP